MKAITKAVRAAVDLGCGDFWRNQLSDAIRQAHVMNSLAGRDGEVLRDEMRMDMATRYGRCFQCLSGGQS